MTKGMDSGKAAGIFHSYRATKSKTRVLIRLTILCKSPQGFLLAMFVLIRSMIHWLRKPAIALPARTRRPNLFSANVSYAQLRF
jgi:hypothetical protein